MTTSFDADGSFKIRHSNTNWDESYPADNWNIWEGAGEYVITFNSDSKDITVVKNGSSSGGGSSGGSTTTTVYAHYNVGYGNSLYIRGDTSPLNWNSGIQMTNVNDNTWKWETTSIPAGQKFECKVLII